MAAILQRELATTKVASSDTLDSKQSMRQAASKHASSHRESDCLSPAPRVLRVLVVDDDQDSADALVALVRHCGHAACAALDGLAALRVVAAQHPDVVLMDLKVPITDGCQFARHLRDDVSRKGCLVIAIATHADDVRRQQCLEAGMDLVLTKPVEPSVVETLLLLECVRVNRGRARGSRHKLDRLA